MTNSSLDIENKVDLKKLSQLNILLAEDNLLNAKLVSILFAQYNIKLEIAENGIEAVTKIKNQPFDIVLMDMEMPVMDGYEATTMMRQELKNDIPIIALTAHALPGEREKCLQLGMNDYIPKPINADDLLISIYNLTCGTKNTFTKISFKKNVEATVITDKVCNMGYLVEATRGNKKIIKNIVAVFFKETRAELSSLTDAIKKTNYTVINDISHKIKSAFPILGISILDPVFKEMEQLSNSTSQIGKIEQLNRRVNIVFNKARIEMKQK